MSTEQNTIQLFLGSVGRCGSIIFVNNGYAANYK